MALVSMHHEHLSPIITSVADLEAARQKPGGTELRFYNNQHPIPKREKVLKSFSKPFSEPVFVSNFIAATLTLSLNKKRF
jgi:hypothetical protein